MSTAGENRTKRWPSGYEYAIAVQDPSMFFDSGLRTGTLRTDMLGMPSSRSGQSAIVFEVTTSEVPTAVRCFTSPPSDGKSRYDALAAHLQSTPCAPLVPATWVDQGVNIDGHWFPVVKMDWAPGRPLNLAVEAHLHDASALIELSKRWADCVYALESAGLAHGDLQHGNILVDTDLRIRLVDLDGVWVPTLDGRPPREFGHPNFQHPARDDATWGRHTDAFSALAIYVALRAVAADASLWNLYNNGENLLFSRQDFEQPGETPLWNALDASTDVDVAIMAALLRNFCDLEPNLATSLSFIVRTRSLPMGIPRARSLSPLTGPSNTEWWAAAEPPVTAALAPPPPRPPKKGDSTPTGQPQPVSATEATVAPVADTPVVLRRKQFVRFGSTAVRTGLVGGVVAGLVGFLVHAAIAFTSNTASLVTLVVIVSGVLGLFLNSWQSFTSGSRSAFLEAPLGAASGAAFGLLALAVGDAIFAAAVGGPTDPIVAVVAIIWAIVGAFVGAGIGVGRRSWSRGAWGFVGGAWGGMLGGIIFGATAAHIDPKSHGLVVEDKWQTLLALVIAGSFIGLSVGLVERIRRDIWLTVVEGPTRGMEFVIYKTLTSIGARRQDVTLTGDQRIEGHHAMLVHRNDTLLVELDWPAELDGHPASTGCVVSDGAVLRFGDTYVRVNRK